MKKLLLLLIISNTLMADDSQSEFYEPSESNAYQGKLFYDASKEGYPTDKMIDLCKDYTGLDTAQIKCKEKDHNSLVVCEYKCSLHWLTKKKDKIK